MKVSFLEDCITPTRHAAPWVLPMLAVLIVVLPVVLLGLWHMAFLWQANVPIFLLPLVWLMSFILGATLIALLVGLWILGVQCWAITSSSYRWRLAKTALSKQDRAMRSWQVLKLTMRLASARKSAETGGIQTPSQWQDAWMKVSKARAHRKDLALHDALDLGVAMNRACSPLVVCLMWALIAFGQYVFFAHALPWFQLNWYFLLAVLVPTAFMAARMFYDYAQVLVLSPGHPYHAECDGALPSLEASDVSSGGDLKRKWCARCNSWKPPRCHHCRICRRCVLKMDHHCIFVNNCVGLGNYRHFCLLLVDIVIGAVVLGFCLFPQCLELLGFTKENRRRRGAAAEDFVTRTVVVCGGFIIAVVGALLLTPFSRYHMKRVLLNETTLEEMKRVQVRKKRDVIAADEVVTCSRTPLENFSEVFGAPPVWCRKSLEPALDWLASRKHSKRNQ